MYLNVAKFRVVTKYRHERLKNTNKMDVTKAIECY